MKNIFFKLNSLQMFLILGAIVVVAPRFSFGMENINMQGDEEGAFFNFIPDSSYSRESNQWHYVRGFLHPSWLGRADEITSRLPSSRMITHFRIEPLSANGTGEISIKFEFKVLVESFRDVLKEKFSRGLLENRLIEDRSNGNLISFIILGNSSGLSEYILRCLSIIRLMGGGVQSSMFEANAEIHQRFQTWVNSIGQSSIDPSVDSENDVQLRRLDSLPSLSYSQESVGSVVDDLPLIFSQSSQGLQGSQSSQGSMDMMRSMSSSSSHTQPIDNLM